MKTYTFTVLCKSGEKKTTTITADNFTDARQQLVIFAENN